MNRRCALFALLLLPSCFTAKYCSDELQLCTTDIGEEMSTALAQHTVTQTCEEIPEAWWELFCDAQLTHMVEVAIGCNPTVQEAQHRVCRAYQIALEARSRLLPQIQGDVTYQEEQFHVYSFTFPALALPAANNLFLTVINALAKGTWEIDVWGKNRNLYLSRLDETTAQYADFLQAKLVLSTTICSVYFALQAHLEQLTLLRQEIADKEQVTELLRQRFNKGVSSEFFLYQEDRDLALLVDQANALEGVIASDKHALSALVGNAAALCCESAELEVAPSAVFEGAFPLPATLPLDLVARRPDIRAQIWRIDAAKREVKAAKARFFPNLDLQGSLGFLGFFFRQVTTLRALDLDGNVASSLPLYTGGELTARLGESQENLEIAVQRYNQTLLEAVKEVSDALSSLTTADKRAEDIGVALADAENLQQLTQQKYAHGIETYVSVLNAHANVLVQALTQSEIRLARMEALVALIRAVGGGYYGGE